jgi:hypothetical protein
MCTLVRCSLLDTVLADLFLEATTFESSRNDIKLLSHPCEDVPFVSWVNHAHRAPENKGKGNECARLDVTMPIPNHGEIPLA